MSTAQIATWSSFIVFTCLAPALSGRGERMGASGPHERLVRQRSSAASRLQSDGSRGRPAPADRDDFQRGTRGRGPDAGDDAERANTRWTGRAHGKRQSSSEVAANVFNELWK